jgi:hypothetical protein
MTLLHSLLSNFQAIAFKKDKNTGNLFEKSAAGNPGGIIGYSLEQEQGIYAMFPKISQYSHEIHSV